ncbi:hypothetical protein SAMN05216337_105040 [Bradyrhizobium brasilense]|uniref:Uncharacterized protein n=1 Tax=Bradyrhizobium brasilense TaxID=1419277 RepID=A0A1G7JWW8_9BRAD|nr:hypothetical protein SAMN05216337_105040 [Bradyrhizobium brasilense]
MVPCLFLGCHETYARYHADADHSRSGSHERCMIPALDAMTELTLAPVRRWGRFFGLAPCRMAGKLSGPANASRIASLYGWKPSVLISGAPITRSRGS